MTLAQIRRGFAALVLLPLTAGVAPALTIPPDAGVDPCQPRVTFSGPTIYWAPYGVLAVDHAELLAATGIQQGYLNMVTEQGWVVRNLPIAPDHGYPGLSVMFDLGQVTRMPQLLAHVDISPEPSTDFQMPPTAGFMPFPMGEGVNNAQGSDVVRTANPAGGINFRPIDFRDGGATDFTWQDDHPSVEQDVNQCGPGAVGNSLQWLEDKGEITVPHPHDEGTDGDGTLMGELDVAMGRAPGEPVASAKRFVEGKLDYIDDNGLADDLSVKYKTAKGQPSRWLDRRQHQVGAATAVRDTSKASLFDWIQSELADGEDVELRIGWDDGSGHFIDLIGAGHVLGQPWIAWVHDSAQGEPGGAGPDCGGIAFSWIDGNKLVCYINGVRAEATLDYAVSESKKP